VVALACLGGLGVGGTGICMVSMNGTSAPAIQTGATVEPPPLVVQSDASKTDAVPKVVPGAKPELISMPASEPARHAELTRRSECCRQATADSDRPWLIISISTCSRYPARCRTTTATVIVVSSSRPLAGLAAREQQDDLDAEAPHPRKVCRI